MLDIHNMSSSEIKSRETAQDQQISEQNTVWTKTICGIETKVIGSPKILTGNHIEQLEAVSSKFRFYCYLFYFLDFISFHFILFIYLT